MGSRIGIDFGTTFTIVSVLKNNSDKLLTRMLYQNAPEVINYFEHSYNYCGLASMNKSLKQHLKITDIELEHKEKEDNVEKFDAKLKGLLNLKKADSQKNSESGFIVLSCVKKVILKGTDNIRRKLYLLYNSVKYRILRFLQLFLIERKLKFPIQHHFLTFSKQNKFLAL